MPILSLTQINEFDQRLHYHMDNVGSVALAEPQLESEVNALEKMVEEHIGLTSQYPELAPLFYKLGIWYAFHKRQPDKARKYLQLYLDTCSPDKLAGYVHALNLLGHAYSIDPSLEAIKNAQQYFVLAKDHALKRVIEIASKTDESIKLQREQAYAFKYIGLFLHRNNQHEEAQKYFSDAINIFAGTGNGQPDIHLAESHHLLAVSLTRQKRFTEALKELEKALAMERDYVKAHGPHFMLFVTMQSIADTKRQLAEALKKENAEQAKKLLEEAFALLKEAYAGQLEFYRMKEGEGNPDIGKTVQFMGDVQLSMGNYSNAGEYFVRAFDLKVKLYGKAHDAVEFTRRSFVSLLKAYQDYFDFDWNDNQKTTNSKSRMSEVVAILGPLLARQGDIGEEARQQLATLVWKVSTYFNHVERDPIAALNYQWFANDYFSKIPKETNKLAHAWTVAHIAFSLQQIVFQAKAKPAILQAKEVFSIATMSGVFSEGYLKEKKDGLNQEDVCYLATHYLNLARQMVAKTADINEIKVMAFANCVDALVKYENGQLEFAVKSYRAALDLYEKNGLQHDGDQYARAKNRYAQMLCEQKKPLQDPHIVYKELLEYWSSRSDAMTNTYAARFYHSYGKYLLEQDNKQAALEGFKSAVKILVTTEGEKSEYTKVMRKLVVDLENELKPPVSVTKFSLTPVPSPMVVSVHPKDEQKSFTPGMTTNNN